MSQVTIGLIFVLAFLVTAFRGAGWGFVMVYLPAMILLNQLPQIPIVHAPLAAHFAAIYGIILAMPFRPESLRFKWSSVDTIIALLLISSTITAFNTENFEAGINNFRTELVTWVGPYFLARIVFRNVEIRRGALYVLIALMAIISTAALIEFRIQPYFYLHLLQGLGMNNKIPTMAYYRFGFFRVAGPVQHPIYFGNMCLVLIGMIAVLARTTGTKLTNPWVALALFGALGCLVTSISFTPYIGLGAGIAVLLTLVMLPFTRKLVLPLTLLGIGVLFTFTYTVAHQKIGDKPDGELAGSLWTRKEIIQQSWKKAASAGAFGYGRQLNFGNDEDDDFDLSSVDNAYMLHTMMHGWIYTTLWVSIAVFFSMRMTFAFFKITHESQVFPLAVATATVLALMVSMFTVWAGALYVVVWSVMLGLSNTLIDLVMHPEMATESTRRPMAMGRQPKPPGVPMRIVQG